MWFSDEPELASCSHRWIRGLNSYCAICGATREEYAEWETSERTRDSVELDLYDF
jgi:hypothetical protein